MPFIPDHPPSTLIGQLARRIMGPIPTPVTTTIGPLSVPLGDEHQLRYLTRAMRATWPDVLGSGELAKDVLEKPTMTNIPLRNGTILPNIDAAADPTGYISTLRHISGPGAAKPTMIERMVNDLSSYFTSPKYDPFPGK